MIQITVLLFLGVFVSGFWLSRFGRPFNAILLAVHKLASLAAVLLLVLTVVRVNAVAMLGAIDWVAVAASGLFLLGAIGTGGLWSVDKPTPAAVLTLHRITPFLSVLSTAVTLTLLLAK
jgi:hypothetical protein